MTHKFNTRGPVLGIFDPEGKNPGFCYSIADEPNLWCSQKCDDGSLASHEMITWGINSLHDLPCLEVGCSIDLPTNGGPILRFTVTEEVEKRSVEAFQAHSDTVLKVEVQVIRE